MFRRIKRKFSKEFQEDVRKTSSDDKDDRRTDSAPAAQCGIHYQETSTLETPVENTIASGQRTPNQASDRGVYKHPNSSYQEVASSTALGGGKEDVDGMKEEHVSNECESSSSKYPDLGRARTDTEQSLKFNSSYEL